ncbi:hypothetical protein NAEGRDRAFT_81388 [Naegleria gruberi]|uniref:RRM domain-containing protein n=1 Tax=Naegleria gruberi TaxID=5762 RepID=D2VVK2_NAEGR|nr:uncharacterized protein NAEGRDRAFT_81388 [Naegleria gruberi]EFC39049.1 hypothetical protein NAEGRDRAFT_81388 [Naegleria gruberi]|eukprot:XP_002671793.1 hypothetical protein NAEGRDRAFT_81388 [Naegleria gruberi strain NEG-M]
MQNNTSMMKQRLNEEKDKDPEFLKRTICVLELPFVVDEQQVGNFFKKCDGGVKRLEIIRSGALVFSAAFVEFNKQKGKKKAIELSEKVGQEYDVIILSSEDFLEDKIPTRKEASKSAGSKNTTGGPCKNQ